MHLLTLILTAPTADAYSRGRTGASERGCGSCHGSSADSTTGVAFGGPAGVAPGETVDVTFEVSTSSSRSGAGLNVSVTRGGLSGGSNTQTDGGEITHDGTEGMSSSAATFEFTWTAPNQEGDYTFYGVGNAVNRNNSSSGDGWNLTSWTVTVSDDYADDDGDGYQAYEDCDDSDSATYPGAAESCDGIDNNCSGTVDEGVTGTFYEDADGDGFGNPDSTAEDCDAPSGYTTDATDCDDSDGATYPGAEEVSDDGIDQDCDGTDAVTDTAGDEDTGEEDPTGDEDTGEEHDHDTGDDDDDKDGCATVSGGGAWAALLALGVLVGRRRQV